MLSINDYEKSMSNYKSEFDLYSRPKKFYCVFRPIAVIWTHMYVNLFEIRITFNRKYSFNVHEYLLRNKSKKNVQLNISLQPYLSSLKCKGLSILVEC